MKTLPLGELVRRPQSVKKLTAAGQTVTITEQGKALWVVKAAIVEKDSVTDSKAERDEWLDAELDRMLQEPLTSNAVSHLVMEGRR